MFAEASSVLIITRLYQERVSGLKDKANQMIAMMLGPAGHGKSKAIHAITALTKLWNSEGALALAAPAGIAASNIGGVTLHNLMVWHPFKMLTSTEYKSSRKD